MSRVVNTRNLRPGETFDLFIVDLVEGFPNGKMVFRIPSFPRKVTGLQKVVQAFLYRLLTRKGTDLLNPDTGTYFVDYTTYSNRTGSDQQVYTLLNPEIEDAANQTRQAINASAPNRQSQLKSVEISRLSVAQDKIELYLRLITEAGETAAVSVPFPETNLKRN